jgi:hypothetical protein
VKKINRKKNQKLNNILYIFVNFLCVKFISLSSIKSKACIRCIFVKKSAKVFLYVTVCRLGPIFCFCGLRVFFFGRARREKLPPKSQPSTLSRSRENRIWRFATWILMHKEFLEEILYGRHMQNTLL